MKTFQKPLTKAEEAHYISLLGTGTPKEKRKARNILCERNLRLVAHIARKYQNSGEELEDLISIGCIGLIKAIDTFEMGKGALATYICRCVDNEILMFFRSKRKKTREVSLYEAIGQDKEGNEIYLMDVVSGQPEEVEKQVENEEDIKKLYMLMNQCLSDREREILILRYGLFGQKELTQTKVGEVFGISRSYVSRIEKKTIQKLKERF